MRRGLHVGQPVGLSGGHDAAGGQPVVGAGPGGRGVMFKDGSPWGWLVLTGKGQGRVTDSRILKQGPTVPISIWMRLN